MDNDRLPKTNEQTNERTNERTTNIIGLQYKYMGHIRHINVSMWALPDLPDRLVLLWFSTILVETIPIKFSSQLFNSKSNWQTIVYKDVPRRWEQNFGTIKLDIFSKIK